MILTVNIPKREQKITNGDVIKAIFPNIDIEQIEDIIDVYGMSKCRVTYDTDWWNAPYKTESEEEICQGQKKTESF